MGVCSDVSAVSLTINFAADSYCCVQQKASQRFWSGQELMLRENHRGFRNMIFRHMTYSSGSLFFFAPAADSVKFLSCPPPSFRKKKRNLSLLLRLTPSPFCCSIFRVHSNTLFPSPALPSLQSHWPILWRTVKDRRSVYRLASFLGHWDSIDVCELPSHPPLSRTTTSHTHTHTLPACLYKKFSGLERGGWGGVILRVSTSVAIRIQSAVGLYTSFLRRSTQQDKANSIIRPACSTSTIDLAPELQHNTWLNKWLVIQGSFQAVPRCGFFFFFF